MRALLDVPPDADWSGLGKPVSDLPELGGLAARYLEMGEHMPRVLARSAWSADRIVMPTVVDLEDERGAYAPLKLDGWLFGLPRRGAVLMLDLQAEGDLTGVRGAMVDTFWRTGKIRVEGDLTVLEALLGAAGEEVGAQIGQPALGQAYELVVLDDLSLLDGPTVEGVSDLERAVGVGSDELRKLIHRSGDTRWRPGVDHVEFPMHGNRVPGTLTAVGESSSVIVPYASHIEAALVLSVVQAVGSLAVARRVRAETERALLDVGSLSIDDASRRHRLRKLSDELSRLQMRSLEGALPLGVAGQDEFGEAVLRALGVADLASSTAAMLDRLARAVGAERAAIERQEQREAELRQAETLGGIRGLLKTADDARRAGVVLAAVTAIVAGIGLFAALAAIPGGSGKSGVGSDLLLKPALVAGAIATLAVLIASTLGVALFELTRREPEQRFRRPLQWVAGGLVVVAAVMLIVFLSDTRKPALFWTATALIVAGGFLFALAGDFGREERQGEAPDRGAS